MVPPMTFLRASVLLCGALALSSPSACLDDASDGASQVEAPAQCVGPAAPSAADARRAPPATTPFALTDFQPHSCNTGDTYGLERFRGKATLVALLAGW